jgi:prolyl oligopeptidase
MLVTPLIASSLLFLSPPPSAAEVTRETMHGLEIVDEYRWLEALEGESERVREWTTLQNDYTRGVLDELPHRGEIESRIAQLLSIGSIGAPSMRGTLYFNRERKGDENQSILYVREGHDGEPRVLINPNTLDEKGLYALDWYAPNSDGSLLAFGLSHAGDEMTVLHVLDVASGEWLSDEISGKVDFSEWLPDGRGFVYGKLDNPANAYSRSFYVHELGRHWREDPRIFTQDAPSRIPGATISRDGRWFVFSIFEGWAKQEVYIADADHWRRTGEIVKVPVAVGLDATFQAQVMHGDTMYLLTTLDAPNGVLYAVDMNSPQQANWEVVIPERKDAVLQGVSQARGMLVASYEKDAVTRIEKFTMGGRSLGEVALPGIGSAGVSTHEDRTEAFLSYSSFNEPPSIYRFDLAHTDMIDSPSMALWARPEVPVDPSAIVVKQEFCTSKDGTKVPMFIVHHKDLKLDGDNPCILYGYGGFSISLTPSFSATRFPWLESGGVYAVVNLRGGSEYGEAWHRAGMLANKQNVFDDLYAAAEHLIERGYTKKERLGCLGGSNGGLLTGVAVTQRPDLWACAVSAVPLLDMLRYHHFLMAKFWVPEYGSPDDPEHFRWLRAYSPYHNVKPGVKYPAVFFTAGENDNRVHPNHARKMVARMQQQAANDLEEDPILLWVDREGGHGAGKPLAARIREVADQHMFFAWQTGMLDDYNREGNPHQ